MKGKADNLSACHIKQRGILTVTQSQQWTVFVTIIINIIIVIIIILRQQDTQQHAIYYAQMFFHDFEKGNKMVSPVQGLPYLFVNRALNFIYPFLAMRSKNFLSDWCCVTDKFSLPWCLHFL